MANIKHFKVTFDACVEIEMAVDLEKLTPEIATEMNDFWSGGGDLLNDCDGDVIRCAVRLIASKAAHFIAEDSHFEKERFREAEGFHDLDEIGVEITDWYFPDLSAYSACEVEVDS